MNRQPRVVEFYDLPRQRLEKFSVLTASSLRVRDYMSLGAPLTVGKISGVGKALFAPDPNLNFVSTENWIPRADFHFNPICPIDNFQASALKLTERRSQLNDQEALQLRAQAGIIAEVLKFDQRYFGDTLKTHNITFSYDNVRVSPDNLRQREWHLDSRYKIEELDAKSDEAPSRIYLWRPNIPTEVIKNEWQMKRRGLKLHPVVHELVQATRQERFASSKRRVAQVLRVDDLTAKLRGLGMIGQARPYEIVLIANYTMHRSALPKKPMLSAFGQIEIAPNVMS